MAKPKLQYCEVDSIDVSSYVVTWKVTRQENSSISTATIQFTNSITDVVSFDESNAQHTIELSRGVLASNETKVFKGEIISFTIDGRTITCTCYCELYKAVRAEVTKSFDQNIDTEAGNVSEIFSTLMEDYAVLTATVGDSVTDSGAVNVLSKFICNHADVFERCEKLAEVLDWQFYYDPDTDKVYFEEQGSTAATDILTVGSNITNKPVWKYDKSSMVNFYTVVGGQDSVETEQAFDGDGAEDEFTISYTPESVRVEVGGVLQTGGNEATSGTFDYQVDTENKQILFEAGSIPGVGVGNVVIIYTHLLPRPVLAKNAASILTYGEFKKTSFSSELRDVDDVSAYCKKYVSIYSVPFISTALSIIDAEDLWPGQTATVVDNANGINGQFFVTKVEMFYPYTADKITIGDEELRTAGLGSTTTDRIRRLEEEQGSNQDILTHILDQTRTIKYKRRYMKLQKRSLAGSGVFVWSNPVYGVWGTSIWTESAAFIVGNASYGVLGASQLGGGGFGSYTTESLHQGDNTYKELCYDTDFHDAINSTATFDTGNKRIDFTAGQIWYSDVVFIGTSFSFLTLTLGTLTGSVTLEVSADNKGTWQTVTSGVRVAVGTATTAGVYIRITEDAAGAARVAPTTDSYGQVTAPAIKLLMED